MKLHPTAIAELIRIYSNYGGYRDEHKLKEVLKTFDLSQYTQQTGRKDTFLVLTEDIRKHENS